MTTSEERQQMRATAKEGRRAFKNMLADMRNDMALALRFIVKAVLWLAGAAAVVFMLFVINQTQPLHAQYAMLGAVLFWVAVLWFHDQARAAAKHRDAELRLLGEIHNRLRSLELIAQAYWASPPPSKLSDIEIERLFSKLEDDLVEEGGKPADQPRTPS